VGLSVYVYVRALVRRMWVSVGVWAHVCMCARTLSTRSYLRGVERVQNEAKRVRAAERGCGEQKCRVRGCGARVGV